MATQAGAWTRWAKSRLRRRWRAVSRPRARFLQVCQFPQRRVREGTERCSSIQPWLLPLIQKQTSMEIQGNKRLVEILRYITTSAVQLFPFVFTSIYIICIAVSPLLSENSKHILDLMFYVSPIIVFSHLVYSRILKLCKWHRMACLIPTFPLIVSLFDYYIVSLSSLGAYLTNGLIATMSTLLIICAYKVFFK